MALFSMLLEAD